MYIPVAPTEATLIRTVRVVRQYLSAEFDHEGVALDILLESWQNGHPHPSRAFIRQRCYDALRHSRMEKEKLTKRAWLARTVFPRPATAHSEDRDTVERLSSVLEPEEKKAVWYRFYCDYTVKETAKHMRLDVNTVSELLQGAIYKMRVEAGKETL